MTRAKRVLRGVDRLMTWLGCALRVNNTRMRLVYRSTGAVQSGYRLTSAVQSGYRLTNQGLPVKQKVLDKCGVGWFDACA